MQFLLTLKHMLINLIILCQLRKKHHMPTKAEEQLLGSEKSDPLQ